MLLSLTKNQDATIAFHELSFNKDTPMKNSLLLLLLLLTTVTFSQTQGPNNPSAATGVPNSSCLACPGGTWSNETNVFLADNNSAFVVAASYPNCFQSNCYYSRFLYASNFGFNIPVASVITGIVVEVNRNPGNPNAIVDSTVRLYDGSNMVGANRAISTPWANGFNYQSYGSMTDLWGAAWTPALINNAGFGLYFKLYNSAANVVATVAVDHIRITVYYSTVSGVHSQTMSSGGFSVFQNENENVQGQFNLVQSANCKYELYSITGSLLKTVDLGVMVSGVQKFEFSSTGLPKGIYFLRLSAGNELITKKISIH